MISNLKKNKDKYTVQELDAKIKSYEKDYELKINKINDEREKLLNNDM